MWSRLLSWALPAFLTGLYTTITTTPTKTTGSAVFWTRCAPPISNDFDCAFFEVPLDYADASVGTGKLAVVKVKATEHKIGTLFLNPGGPGLSGVAILTGLAPLALALTGGKYDIVSWDPRGVGSLTVPGGIFCFDNATEYEAFWDGSIELTGIPMSGNFTDQAEIDALLAQAPIMEQKYKELGERCEAHPTGKYLPYVGTAATARDLAGLADAIDGRGSKVNFYGLSYGTLLGSWFMNMFPERVGHFILDGVENPITVATAEPSLYWGETSLRDSQTVYKAFVTGCSLAGPKGCFLAMQNSTAADVDAAIQIFLAKAQTATLWSAPRGLPFTFGDVRAMMYAAMFTPSVWNTLANDIILQYMTALSVALTTLPAWEQTASASNVTVSYTGQAIMCGDSVDPRNTTMKDIFEGIINSTQARSSMFGPVWPLRPYYCSFWPVRAVERYEGPFTSNKTLANKVLVVGNTFDPATPFRSAQALADLLGDQAALLQVNAFGHTAMRAGLSTCFIDVIRRYLDGNELPSEGTVCEVDGEIELFPGINTATILEAGANSDLFVRKQHFQCEAMNPPTQGVWEAD